MKKKAISFLLVLALCLGLMPAASGAAAPVPASAGPDGGDVVGDGQSSTTEPSTPAPAPDPASAPDSTPSAPPVPSAPGSPSNAHEKYMDGYADGTFRPNALLSRAELAQMLYAVIEERPEPLASFADVPETAWYYQAAGTLGALCVMGGDDGMFRGDQPVTRAECAVVLARMLWSGISLDAPPQRTFDDVPETHWAYAEISQAAAYGLFADNGTGNFSPDSALTRAEAAAVFNRLLGRAADEAVLSSRSDLRVFPDVPADFWAYGEIMEATVPHVNVPDGVGRESWAAVAAERTALTDGYHDINGYVCYVADGVILRGVAGETCADPNGYHLVYDESGRARATLPDGYHIMNGSVYHVKDGMFLYSTSDGYLTYDAYGRAASASNPVRLILQNPQLCNGCEVTSLAMALTSAGFPADKMVLYQDYLPKAGFYYQEAVRYGPNPEEYYVGNAAARTGGWYCFEGPVAQAGNAWLESCGSDLRALPAKGLSQEELDVYAKAGLPVIAWVTLNYAAPRLSSTTWRMEDGTLYHPYSNLHCVILTGMSGEKYQIADPINGMRTVGRDEFWGSFSAMGGRAVVVA